MKYRSIQNNLFLDLTGQNEAVNALIDTNFLLVKTA